MSNEQPEDVLKSIARGWLKKIELAKKHKRPFTEDAREAMDFFDGPQNWFWKEQYSKSEYGYNRSIAPPGFRMQVNRVFEAVKLFASVIYHRNPVRSVSPNKYPTLTPESIGLSPDDPMAMQQFEMATQQSDMLKSNRSTVAQLMARLLNYTPNELDLKSHSRRVVDEAIIKGMGVWWTEMVTFSNGRRMVGSFADSVDNLILDPDATEIEDILWCARRCVHPIDVVAEKYGVDREKLKGNLQGRNATRSGDSSGMLEDDSSLDYKQVGKTNELVTYYKIWSKTGIGDRLKDMPKEVRGIFDGVGENCYVVVAQGLDEPLNIQPNLLQEPVDPETGLPPNLFRSVQWPIPFWAENNGWPFTGLAFHRKPGYVWPISHIKPGIPELRFLCWAFSFLAQRVATSCETLIGVSKSADQDIKDQILSQSEAGFKIVEVSEMMGRSVNDLISVFQLPDVTGEIWGVISAVTDMLDKRLGMTELIYGLTSSQMRSATEASVKSEQISVRPDDMAEQLENSMSQLARKEAIASRWLLEPEDVASILGPIGVYAWQQYIMPLDPSEVSHEYDYRIESGSARKPNKATRVEQMNTALQTLGPVLQQLIPMGNVQPFNALVMDWADSMDLDATPYLIPEMAPPQPELPLPGGGQPSPSPEEAQSVVDAGAAPEAPAEGPPPQIPQELQV